MTKAEFTIYQREWRKRNPEKMKQYRLARTRREIDELRPRYIRRLVRSQSQRVRWNAYQRQWRKDNPDKVKCYRAKGKDREKVTRREWLRRNPEKKKAIRKNLARRRIDNLLDQPC